MVYSPRLMSFIARSLALAAVLASCLHGGAVAQEASSGSEFQAPPTSEALSSDYRIGARDLLEIRVFDLEQLDSTVRVSEEGTISLPLIGQLRAQDLTRSGLEDAIATALKRYVNEPQVSVFIREYQSQRISVIGAVEEAGTFEMVGTTTLLEALSMAGGVNWEDASGRATILRKGFVGEPISLDLDELINEGNTAFNVELEPGDTINVVPKRRYFIYVYGAVRNPGSYQLREQVTLLQAISLAGGLGDRAQKKIKIQRAGQDGVPETIEVNLDEIIDGKIVDVPIRPNDVIIVPESFF